MASHLLFPFCTNAHSEREKNMKPNLSLLILVTCLNASFAYANELASKAEISDQEYYSQYYEKIHDPKDCPFQRPCSDYPMAIFKAKETENNTEKKIYINYHLHISANGTYTVEYVEFEDINSRMQPAHFYRVIRGTTRLENGNLILDGVGYISRNTDDNGDALFTPTNNFGAPVIEESAQIFMM